MDKFVIEGPARLAGEVDVAGAKNAALPCLAAALLTAEPVRLTNLPDVADIRTMRRLLEHIGARIEAGPEEATIEVPSIGSADAPYELVKTMRASVLVLGPLLARAGSVRVSLPGGCAIGVRPINLHLQAFEKLGAEVRLEHGYVEAKAARLTGADVAFETVTVTGTENVMLAATLARGTTRILNAAREPEVTALAMLLEAMGAKISGAGTETIVVEGVDALHGADASDHPGPHRGRHVRDRGGRDARRRRGAPLRAGAPLGADGADVLRGRPDRHDRRHAPRARRRAAHLQRRRDGPLSRASRRTCRPSGWRSRPAWRASRRSPRRSSRTASSTSPSSSAWAPGSASRAAGRSSRAPRG